MLDGEFGDLAGQVSGDAFLQLQTRQMRAQNLVVQFDRPSEATAGHVLPHCRIQLGEAVGQLGPVDDLVGDAREEFLCGWKHWCSDVGLMDLGFRGRKFQLQADSERLGEFLLVVDRIEQTHVQIGQLTKVVLQGRLGDGNRNVVRAFCNIPQEAGIFMVRGKRG